MGCRSPDSRVAAWPLQSAPSSEPETCVRTRLVPLHCRTAPCWRSTRAADGAFAGSYTDCYAATVDGDIGLDEFVSAFYTTPLFRLERALLRWFARRPSTDPEARAVAEGSVDRFAAWTVEARASDQLLMCDIGGRTRSWFMVVPTRADPPATTLHFGSAVIARPNPASGEPELGTAFALLLGFHERYSLWLLRAAARALSRR